MTTCFLLILGNGFNTLQVIMDNPSSRLLGPIVFALYYIFVVFILLNVFVTIISETFSLIRNEDKKKKNDFELQRFLKEQLETLKKAQNEYDPLQDVKYFDHVAYFPIKIDQLLLRISQINTSQQEFIRTYQCELKARNHLILK